MKKQPKFKKGDKVSVENMGKGIIYDSYLVKNKFLYHIEQDDYYMMGNIPESFIAKIKEE